MTTPIGGVPSPKSVGAPTSPTSPAPTSPTAASAAATTTATATASASATATATHASRASRTSDAGTATAPGTPHPPAREPGKRRASASGGRKHVLSKAKRGSTNPAAEEAFGETRSVQASKTSKKGKTNSKKLAVLATLESADNLAEGEPESSDLATAEEQRDSGSKGSTESKGKVRKLRTALSSVKFLGEGADPSLRDSSKGSSGRKGNVDRSLRISLEGESDDDHSGDSDGDDNDKSGRSGSKGNAVPSLSTIRSKSKPMVPIRSGLLGEKEMAKLDTVSLRLEPGLWSQRFRSPNNNIDRVGGIRVVEDFSRLGDQEASPILLFTSPLRDDDDDDSESNISDGEEDPYKTEADEPSATHKLMQLNSRGAGHRLGVANLGSPSKSEKPGKESLVDRQRRTPAIHPYSRIHIYGEDHKAAGWPNEENDGPKKWQPLSQPQMASVRQSLTRHYSKKEGEEVTPADTAPSTACINVIALKLAPIAAQAGVQGRHGMANLYCRVEAMGMADSSFRTKGLEQGGGTVWNHEEHICIEESCPTLKFSLHRHMPGGLDKLIASGTLASEEFAEEIFHGDVELSNARHQIGSIEVEVALKNPLARAKLAFEALRGLSFLQNLWPDRALELLQKVTLWDVAPGEVIYEQDGPVDYMYVVAQGSIRLEAKEPAWGNYPVTLSSVYDGGMFGDRIMVRRGTTAIAQEQSCLLCMLQTDYRAAFDSVEESSLEANATSPSPGVGAQSATSNSPGSLNVNLHLRVANLMKSPLFRGAGALRLSHLASNLTEVELREGDLLLKPGQRVQCCYLVLQGFVKVFALPTLAIDDESNDDFGRPLGGIDLPCLSDRPSRPCRTGGLQELFTPRLPPGPKRSGPRRRGQPKPRAPWEEKLRSGDPPGWAVTPPKTELHFGFLHPGDSFGIGLLDDLDPDQQYTSDMFVRVESCNCRLLQLTNRCLWYLPESVVATTKAFLANAEDPLKAPPYRVRDAWLSRRNWNIQKQKLVEKEMLTAE